MIGWLEKLASPGLLAGSLTGFQDTPFYTTPIPKQCPNKAKVRPKPYFGMGWYGRGTFLALWIRIQVLLLPSTTKAESFLQVPYNEVPIGLTDGNIPQGSKQTKSSTLYGLWAKYLEM